jgi:hypothetical protein
LPVDSGGSVVALERVAVGLGEAAVRADQADADRDEERGDDQAEDTEVPTDRRERPVDEPGLRADFDRRVTRRSPAGRRTDLVRPETGTRNEAFGVSTRPSCWKLGRSDRPATSTGCPVERSITVTSTAEPASSWGLSR